MNLATDVTKLPRSSQKEIVDGLRYKTEHQHEIRDGQIDDQHISWGTKIFEVTKNLQDHYIATDCHPA